VADVRTVLGALATQPAQVAAGAGSGRGGSGGGGDAGIDGGASMEVDGTGGDDGGGGGGEGTVGYLSSPQLFGLQLRDATFRRDLLVQVRWGGGAGLRCGAGGGAAAGAVGCGGHVLKGSPDR
jgi:hypothetical protein